MTTSDLTCPPRAVNVREHNTTHVRVMCASSARPPLPFLPYLPKRTSYSPTTQRRETLRASCVSMAGEDQSEHQEERMNLSSVSGAGSPMVPPVPAPTPDGQTGTQGREGVEAELRQWLADNPYFGDWDEWSRIAYNRIPVLPRTAMAHLYGRHPEGTHYVHCVLCDLLRAYRRGVSS